MTLYQLRNKVTGLIYIGATRQPMSRRLSDHRRCGGAGKWARTYLISCAIREYGWENFEVVVLGTAKTFEELMEMESAAIRTYGTFAPQGYNMTAGGVGTKDRRHGEHTRRAISARTQGRRPWNLGIPTGPMPEAVRQKQSDAHQGQRAWNKGLSPSDETRRKMSASHTGWRSPVAHAIELEGVTYPSLADAGRATGLSKMQVTYRIATGRGRYLDGAQPPSHERWARWKKR
jgi:group I intron endonuclease